MKELITQALDEVFSRVLRQVPQTKKKTESIGILDVRPLHLEAFMSANGIPEHAYFSSADNTDEISAGEIYLAWEVDVPTTDKDKAKFKRDKFSVICFPPIYKLLTSNGYKRIPCDSRAMRRFDGTTVYDMYSNKEFDRLLDYYSLFFKPDG
jgi:hypothetical protein